MWLSILALVVACEGHVQLFHKASINFTRPIRNAPSVAADGTLSTAGPCGGVLTWGNKTFSTVTPGENVSLAFAYNGGHQSATDNMLRVAMVCGRPNSDALLRNTTVAPTSSPEVNASTSKTLSAGGYDLWVIIPQIPTMTNGQFCTISVLDKRNWGGCVDVEIVNAGAPTPAPANALAGVSLTGSYSFGTTQCVTSSPGCCCLVGAVNVTHATGAATATGSLVLTSCVNGSVVTNMTTSTTITLDQTASNLASLRGSVAVGSNTLTFQATPAGAVVTDTSSVPMYCGLQVSALAPTAGPGTPGANSASVRGLVAGAAVTMGAVLFF